MTRLPSLSEKYREIRERLKNSLSEARYAHSLGVAATAACMAMRYDISLLEKAYLAGLVHDAAKCLPDEEKLRMAEEKGIYYFDWNVSSGDATGTPISTEQVYRNVVNGVLGLKGKPAVVLQHDIKGFSVDAVEDIIKWGLANGYTFMPLDETSYGAHHGINN